MTHFIVYFCSILTVSSMIFDEMPIWMKIILISCLVICFFGMQTFENRTNSRITKLETELEKLKERGREK